MDLTPTGYSSITPPEPNSREFRWPWVWLALGAALSVGAIVGYLLWGKTTAEHKDAFDAAWKSSAAVLAILATFISVDRFRLSQREHRRQLLADHFTQRHAQALLQRQLDADQAARDDAIARQITDLSAKASEQLGSDKAAVRIGGLTDLERLAQAHPELRQTVIDRICAYLRAPYQPPPTTSHASTLAAPDQPDPAAAEQLSQEEVATRRLELDVRRTAEQILTRHLRWPRDTPEPPPTYWPDISLDLRDASLIEFRLSYCRINNADFRNAHFHTNAFFENATFTGYTWFDRATFSGQAWFGGATFSEHARFGGATFSGRAWFDQATFSGQARFPGATFSEDAWFEKTTFSGNAWFEKTTFSGQASFVGATFSGHNWFVGATFSEDASFVRATFSGQARFPGATFSEDAWFEKTTFSEDARFDKATFSRQASFVGATFFDTATLVTAQFERTPLFDGARVMHPDKCHAWPRPWRVEPDPTATDGSGLLTCPT